MSRIAIIGAGRVGTAAAKIILYLSDHEVLLIDESIEALEQAANVCLQVQRDQHRVLLYPQMPITCIVAKPDEIHQLIRDTKPDLIMNATPFTETVEIVRLAIEEHIHYIDFTEDIESTNTIQVPDYFGKTIVPQTGLAPGLVNYLGLSLFNGLSDPRDLKLRVGALPAVSFAPHYYAETWSAEGLINEYLKAGESKVDGVTTIVPPLSNHELLNIKGVMYEAFSTSGGTGMLQAYSHVPTVDYKTIRHPGHLQWLHNFLDRHSFDYNTLVEATRSTFVRTRDDRVVLVAYAVDVDGDSNSVSLVFNPSELLDLTALELTTAGTGVAIAEMILAGALPPGLLHAGDIDFDALMTTASMTLVFDHSE